jgi:hypothetical protein
MKMLTKEVIEKLVRRELEKGEKEFGELFTAAQEGRITWEEFRDKSRTLQGYGVWWSSEAHYSLGKVEVNEVNELGDGLYEISATCDMFYESGHIVWGEGGELEEYAIRPKKASVKIKLRVNDALKVEEFNFRWI